MSAIDKLQTARTCVKWERIDDSGPGLHEPKREGDVGWDLECSERTVIKPGEAVDVPTNVRLHLPEFTWAEIRARSSIVRKGLAVESGTIDTGYRGPLFVLVRNMRMLSPFEAFRLRDLDECAEWLDSYCVVIEKGERVGQVVFHKVAEVWAQEVSAIDLNTDRGTMGFGSTGV